MQYSNCGVIGDLYRLRIVSLSLCDSLLTNCPLDYSLPKSKFAFLLLHHIDLKVEDFTLLCIFIPNSLSSLLTVDAFGVVHMGRPQKRPYPLPSVQRCPHLTNPLLPLADVRI